MTAAGDTVGTARFALADSILDYLALGKPGTPPSALSSLITENDPGASDFAQLYGLDATPAWDDALSNNLQTIEASTPSMDQTAAADEGLGGEWLDTLGPEGEAIIPSLAELVPVVALGGTLTSLLVQDFTTGTNPVSEFLFGDSGTQAATDYGGGGVVTAMQWQAIPLVGEPLGDGPIGVTAPSSDQLIIGINGSLGYWTRCGAAGGCHTGDTYGAAPGTATELELAGGNALGLFVPNTGKKGYVLQFHEGTSTWYDVGLASIDTATDSAADPALLTGACAGWPGDLGYTYVPGWAPTPPHANVLTDPGPGLYPLLTFISTHTWDSTLCWTGGSAPFASLQPQAVYRTTSGDWSAPETNSGCPGGATCTTVDESTPAGGLAQFIALLTRLGNLLRDGSHTHVGNFLGTVALGQGQPDSAYSGLVIPAPYPNELATDYQSTLEGDGFTNVSIDVLTDDQADPSQGPSAVVSVTPHAGTYAQPATDIAIDANPADAPAPASSGNPFDPPGVPGLKLPAVSTPCNVFPFGAPCWLATQLGQFNAAPVAPSFTVGTPFSGSNIVVDLGSIFGVDFSTVMGVVRPVLLVLSFIGLMVWLAGLAMGGSTGGGGDAAEE
jgi:hypothetical protein